MKEVGKMEDVINKVDEKVIEEIVRSFVIEDDDKKNWFSLILKEEALRKS